MDGTATATLYHSPAHTCKRMNTDPKGISRTSTSSLRKHLNSITPPACQPPIPTPLRRPYLKPLKRLHIPYPPPLDPPIPLRHPQYILSPRLRIEASRHNRHLPCHTLPWIKGREALVCTNGRGAIIDLEIPPVSIYGLGVGWRGGVQEVGACHGGGGAEG